MATYVLVHGGGHGGWCYQKVARLLRAEGHDVYTPTLTGLGERRHLLSPDVDLAMHIADVIGLLIYEDLRDVILAGHSYGGMVITGVADRTASRIRELVYLDAAHPANGQSLADNAPGMMTMCAAHVKAVEGVELVMWEQSLQPEFFGITDPADAAWARPRLNAHPWKCYTQPLDLVDEAAVRAIPRTDIDCTPNIANWDAARHAESKHAARAWHIDTGHDLMITEPEALAGMLLRLA